MERNIAIIGGTGKEGKGLGFRWALAGYRVLIGSRQQEKALTAAEEIRGLLMQQNISPATPERKVTGMTNEEAAQQADIVVVTVPFSAHRPVLEGLKEYLQGKTLIDVTVPLVPPRVSVVQMPPAGSASMEARQILGDGVKIAAAFQNISYENLICPNSALDCDVLVCGDKEARGLVLELVRAAGMIGWDAGPLENSIIPEGLTSILIGLNKKYGVHASGIRITGIPRPE